MKKKKKEHTPNTTPNAMRDGRKNVRASERAK
jgi:hypothetical protein